MSTFANLHRRKAGSDAVAESTTIPMNKNGEQMRSSGPSLATMTHRLGHTFVIEGPQRQRVKEEEETSLERGNPGELDQRAREGSLNEWPLPRSQIRSSISLAMGPAGSFGPSGSSMSRKARVNVTDSSMGMASTFVGERPTFKNTGPGVFCQSPLFKVSGQVTVPKSMTNGDLTVGFMQALLRATGPKGHYWDANDNPYMSGFLPYTSLPLRDADPGGVFYGPEAQADVRSTSVPVSMSDRPQDALPWDTPDKKGKLQQIVGDLEYMTWLVVLRDSTREIQPLKYIKWSVGWAAAVDESQKEGTSFDVGRITDRGEGQGPMAPIRSGPVANASQGHMQWNSWSG